MIDIMSTKNKTMLLSNLSFDHPLSFNEINDLINMLSQGVNIGQIYFKDDIDIATIEQIKLLLEGLPNIDDSRIEKYIMKSISEEDKERLDKISFLNIDTWNIAYSIEKNKFSVTTLSKYRLIDNWFKNAIDELGDNLSLLEKVCYLYDKAKLFEFNSNSKYGRLPEIIKDGVANSYGYNLVFSELLNRCNIPNIVESYSVDGETNFITIADIKDDKYNIDGIYLFEPSMDTISKEKYRHGLARRMNYNFFGITSSKFNKLNGQVIYNGLLKSLISDDDQEYKHFLNRNIKKYGKNGVLRLEAKFGTSIDTIYNKMSNSGEIPNETYFNIFESRVSTFCKNSDESESLKKALINNYLDRENDLFLHENVKLLSIKEIQVA